MRFAYVLFAVFVCSTVNAQNKIDATLKPPPAPTDVNVVNFPDVQAVGGTVNVGNLPVDADGAVRVTSAPATPGAQARYVVLFEGDLATPTWPDAVYTAAVDTKGYSKIGIEMQGATSYGTVQWGWGTAPARFGWVSENADVDASHQNQCINYYGRGGRVICPVQGDSVRFALSSPLGGDHVTFVGVYLIP
jgi:hypothetical protein